MITLGIETSCDETALALIETRTTNGNVECRVISSLVLSQAELHSSFGGVFPALAKREHGKNLMPLLKKLLDESDQNVSNSNNTTNPLATTTVDPEKFSSVIEKFRTEFAGQNPDLVESFKDCEFLRDVPKIDRIAVTEGPGLEPALWVGITFSKILSELWSIPLIPVNHMEGHIVGSLLESDKAYGDWQTLKPLVFPALALLISGGHTELVKISAMSDIAEVSPAMSDIEKYSIIGQTKDDAVGEAFDKVARLLGLSYPGGTEVSRLAEEAVNENIISTVKLPRPMIHSKDLNFSFSGLKTAVLYAVRDYEKIHSKIDESFKKGLAREFEEAVRDTLDSKLRGAIEVSGTKMIIIGGGVSANKTLRKTFEITANEFGIPLYLPLTNVSGDNALMIALAGALDGKTYSNPPRAQGTMRL